MSTPLQEAYIVEKLDRQDRLVLVKPYLEPHFTVAKEQQKVTISWQGSTKTVGAATAACGDIIIHHHVTGFQKQSLASQKVLMEKSLSAADYPATKLSTTWVSYQVLVLLLPLAGFILQPPEFP